ncbi:protein containing Metal-dependent hydrolase HDOD [Rhodopirellula maiorica SM1]|uniref:Protein containing Metal-dependent hydrolase HDOD n=1 Tax=Rhodopirellula maiorica SM1 TaxID=1265738 RepID=M5RJU5_9BACT|nr:HDOD domain-containing protein [Rhodopirellula maiorica]EMI19580.1 protein containing Metal-dependent hydrolase HDOD [Rhodopirellula maiorica SM1]
MEQAEFLAMVVDDEEIPRQMLEFALGSEGFRCLGAGDGTQAMALLGNHSFDLVVTDIRMPNMHGHALVVQLLERDPPPVIAVHTSVVEPRIVKDLMRRGVDDIVFKPTDYKAFAAKMKMLVSRRRIAMANAASQANDATSENLAGTKSNESSSRELPDRISINDKLDDVFAALPMSPTSIEIYQLTLDNEVETREIVDRIEMEPFLAAEILRLGNSSHYNPSGQRISDLILIVNRIGRRRIGELALGASACNTLKERSFSGLDAELLWRRSTAASIAAQILGDQRERSETAGLVLGAVMHSQGRVGLCTEFPEEYAIMTDIAKHTEASLSDIERRIFGLTQSKTMSQLLGRWNIPSEISWPLSELESSYAQIAKLEPRRRDQVESIKLAVLVGWIAAGDWEPWDVVEFPSSESIQRLNFHSITSVIDATRRELGRIASLSEHTPSTHRETQRVGYMRLLTHGFDFFAEMLPSLGLAPVYSSPESQPRVIINAIGAGASQADLSGFDRERTVVICEEAGVPHWHAYHHIVKLGETHGKFERICHGPDMASVEPVSH